MLRDVVTELDRWTAAGRPAAIATVVQIHRSAPLPVGTVMAVAADGAVVGAVSGGCVEQQVIDVARAVAAGADPQRLRFAPDADPLRDSGLPCGGGLDVLVEAWKPSPAQAAFAAAVARGAAAELRSEAAGCKGELLCTVEPARRLVLVGAGLVSEAVEGLAAPLGWDVTIVDPREAFATRTGQHVVAHWPAQALAAAAPLGPRDALLALSHHPALDDEALALAVTGDVGFVGALGSRRSHADRLKRLRDRGLSAAALERIVGPIGLDLGGWTPAETALSIVGELVADRHGRTGGRLRERDGAIHGMPTTTSTRATTP